MLKFYNKVVLITGAGNGLGKEYALFFGKRQAKVIVNDIGIDLEGEGERTARPADLVVEEIKSNGGQAFANYDSVENGSDIIQKIINNHGRIDVIVHNAGFLRDTTLVKMTELDWDLIHKVHLRSVFNLTRAAWPYMRKQKYGRIITISSLAGLIGNFGQINYSAAKSGIIGFTKSLALEGEKYNILCNVVAPMAESRLTKTILPPDLLEYLKPEYVAPLVIWLAHEDSLSTGGVYECGAGWICKVRLQRSQGILLKKKNEQMNPEDVRDNWSEICDFTNATYLENTDDGFKPFLNAIEAGNSSEKNLKEIEKKFTYNERDVILYALGVGVSTSQSDHLKFLFEIHENFSALPTFGVIPIFSILYDFISSGNINGIEIDPLMSLHGEQYLEIFNPIKTKGQVFSKLNGVEIIDKGKATVIVINVDSFYENGEKMAFNQMVVYIKNSVGHGENKKSEKIIPLQQPPNRLPDASIEEKTSVDQAAIYRLSGDFNPLHIDPIIAKYGGFEHPILHGLSTFGFAARHVLMQFCNNDVNQFKAIKVRFSSTVLPGQTLKTDMWKENNRIYFRCKVLETGKDCLTGGYVDLNISNMKENVLNNELKNSNTKDLEKLLSTGVFEKLLKVVISNEDLSKSINAVLLFNITKQDKVIEQWTTNLKNCSKVHKGEPQNGIADCIVTIDYEDLIELASGKISTNKLLTADRIKVDGHMHPLKIDSLFNIKPESKL